MDIAGLTPLALAAALAITLLAGFVKGAVGFAMPLIMISSFSAFLPPEIALAGLILPTLVTNIAQAFRDGIAAAWGSVRKFWRMILATCLFILISSQFVRDIPKEAFLLLLGVPVTAYAALQLAGRNLALHLDHQRRAEWTLGAIGGLYGGISGVWGPTVLVYLLSTGASKQETIRVTGVIFLIGAVILLGAHLQSGVMNATSLPFSAALVVPAVIGMALGYRAQARLDQALFRRLTQGLLVLTGLNLIRQGLGF
jgi:uncharacterized membrane protein YfcA